MEKKDGFMLRIGALELLKKQKILLRKSYENRIQTIEDFDKFLNDTYEKENKIKKNSCCNIY